ncbi:MAG: DUF559 domain-containing protein [Candidatus Thiodiazotropha sp. (ex Troendleina suluensis)]|nr:DUF559 domain-containing protein [Candidatus Thiodiazotropha sp. (ex Troendleina suluensis)]
MESKGIRVLRFWNNDVLQNTEAVLEIIYNHLLPHPNPLPQGEGYITLPLPLGEDYTTLPLPLREDYTSLPLPLGEGRGEGALGAGFLPQTTLTAIAANLIHATNEDKLIHTAQAATGKEEVSDKEMQNAFKPKADKLVKPFHNPDLRELIEALRKDTDQLIDDSPDTIIGAGYDEEKAEVLIQNWQHFIQDHKNELDAIQLIYQQPYQKRHLSYEQIEKLAEEIQQPPYNLAPIEVWKAYEQLEKNKVKGVPPKELLTNIVSLIRFSTGLSDVLEPFTELVNNRFDNWLKQQEQASQLDNSLSPRERAGVRAQGLGEGVQGRSEGGFSPDQLAWLNKIKDQIAQNAEMTMEDFNYIPFNQEGGLLKARELFGKELETLISELNGYLIA